MVKNKQSGHEQSSFDELYKMALPELSGFLLNDLPVNVNIIDTKGYTAWGNKRMLDTLELYSLDEFVGKHISTWDNPNEIRWDYCQQVITNKKETTVEESFKDVHYLAVRKPIIHNAKVKGILGISIDITAQKQAPVAKQSFLQNINIIRKLTKISEFV